MSTSGWKSTGDLYIEMLEQMEWEGASEEELDSADLAEYLADMADSAPKDE